MNLVPISGTFLSQNGWVKKGFIWLKGDDVITYDGVYWTKNGSIINYKTDI